MRLSSLVSAISFLSIIPLKSTRTLDSESIAYFPIASIALALLCSIFFLIESPTINSLCFLIAWTIITGGLHLDGLADSADALAASHAASGDKKQRFLDIAREPTSGPIAIIALILVLLGKYLTLVALNKDNLIIILFAIALSRLTPIILLHFYDYARDHGLAKHLQINLNNPHIWIISTLPILITALFLPLKISLIAFVTILCILAINHILIKRAIGGITGDTIGATIEVSECTLLIAFTLVIGA